MPADPLIRFGIKNPSPEGIKINSCLFSAYHAVKAHARSGTICIQTSDPLNNCLLRQTWSVFANAFSAEAGELRISTRSFSLAKFINFLCTGELPAQEAITNQPY